MICAWQELLQILPVWLRSEVDKLEKLCLQELRLRDGHVPELKLCSGSRWLVRKVTQEDLKFIINMASRYSPWTASTMAQGYLTAPGGHRIGICGDAVIKDGEVTGIRQITSLCIRVCRDIPGIGKQIAEYDGSVLILGPPGSGKTTLLRDALRLKSEQETVSVVDERGELFPEKMQRGKRMDVLSGCRKSDGIEMVLRSMGPDIIGVDEITSQSDCESLIRAGWCGVRIFATAHASSVSDLQHRPIYRRLYDCGLFDHLLVMNRDKSWHREDYRP